MANVSWSVPGTSGKWDSTTKWTGLPVGESYPGQAGPFADAVTIGANIIDSPYTVTFNVPSASIGSLEIEGGIGARNATTLELEGGNTLTIQGGLTLLLNETSAGIDGSGTIVLSGGQIGTAVSPSFPGVTPASGTITAGTDKTGGILDLAGTGSISGGIEFAIGTFAPTTLELNLAGSIVTTVGIKIDNDNQTLKIGPSGQLDISALQNVTGGRILMAGGKLTDTRNISFGNGDLSGSLSGFGTVTGDLTMSGKGTKNTITASGGTLDLTGRFGAGLVAAISAGSASTLKFDNVATSDAAIAITSVKQTLEIGSAGELTIGAAENVTLGKIKLDGGSILDLGVGGISFGTGTSSGSLSGFGVVEVDALTRSGSGTADTITATGGNLTLLTTIGSNSGLVFNVGDSPASSLQLDIAPGTGNTFTFLGSAGNLALVGFETYNVGVAGLNVGSTKKPTNFVDILGKDVTVTSGQTGAGTSGAVTLSNGDTFTLTSITNVSGPWHVLTTPDGATGTDVFLSTVCFAAGTHILTATGERVIESLLRGDIVLTLSDGQLSARPVKWVGRRRIDLTAHPRPEAVAPVRIQRGAFADNMPHTDLLLSPDHAVFVDGMLICIRQLVNGSTIRTEGGWTAVDYYHVELDDHGILLAEGLPAESYLDTGNRGFFANAGAPLVLHPDLTVETNYPTREVGSCAPFVWDETSVQPVWQKLTDRAAALGDPAAQRATTTDADLQLLADRRPVKPVFSDSDRVIFVLPRGAHEVRLVSRAQSPTEARPWLEDRRRLGVRVKRIVLRGADELREVPVDHPDLTRGWWAVERDGQIMSRWTDGEAVLPLPAVSGHLILEIHLAGSMIYAVDAAPGDGTAERTAA
jgi:hypothetical protein